MDENSILSRLRTRVKPFAGSGIVRGIGDDCAIFRQRGAANDLLFTTDLLIEDVHFRRSTHPPEATGHKALARGLSDIAAMGGEPSFCLLSLALPGWADQRWIDRFYRGLLKLAGLHNVTLAGGDLARATQLTCDIVVCGSAPKGTALLRSGARPGDAIYVSGRLGGSALGLQKGDGLAWKRHLKPTPRLALGKFLREKLSATAAMDLSDGISMDLRRLCLASGVSAVIDRPVPRFAGATEDQALHGGEDYELLFTVRSGAIVPPHFEKLPLTRLGSIAKGKPGRVEYLGKVLQPLGYDHFRPTHS